MVMDAVVNAGPSTDPSLGMTCAWITLFLSKYCAPSSVPPVYTKAGPLPVSTYQSMVVDTESPSASVVLEFIDAVSFVYSRMGSILADSTCGGVFSTVTLS